MHYLLFPFGNGGFVLHRLIELIQRCNVPMINKRSSGISQKYTTFYFLYILPPLVVDNCHSTTMALFNAGNIKRLGQFRSQQRVERATRLSHFLDKRASSRGARRDNSLSSFWPTLTGTLGRKSSLMCLIRTTRHERRILSSGLVTERQIYAQPRSPRFLTFKALRAKILNDTTG